MLGNIDKKSIKVKKKIGHDRKKIRASQKICKKNSHFDSFVILKFQKKIVILGISNEFSRHFELFSSSQFLKTCKNIIFYF
jgi:hypothetical protein